MSAASPGDVDGWIGRQYALSARHMLRAVSAVELLKERRGFGRLIRPARGSILASPAIAAYDPDPDYFFHWLRDSAIVVDALRRLIESGALDQRAGLAHFSDFLAFSLSLCRLDGADFLASAGEYRAKVEPHFTQFLRPRDELLAIRGDDALGEPRFDPDGSLDILKWSRPQHDGPALRVIVVLRFLDSPIGLGAGAEADAGDLLRRDLSFTLARRRRPSFDIWEEELGRHYYTQLVQSEALRLGGRWLERRDDAKAAADCLEAAAEIEANLDDFWDDSRRIMRSRLEDESPEAKAKELDIAAILAAIHAGRESGPHSPADLRLAATLEKLEQLFARSYAINARPPGAIAPAMGRYADDRYYSGGAYFFSTLGAAEFCFRAALAAARDECDPSPWVRLPGADGERLDARLLRRGEAFLATAAAHAAEDGDLSEQFDQTDGAQTSAKTLAWSHAAFISACDCRAEALRALRETGPADAASPARR